MFVLKTFFNEVLNTIGCTNGKKGKKTSCSVFCSFAVWAEEEKIGCCVEFFKRKYVLPFFLPSCPASFTHYSWTLILSLTLLLWSRCGWWKMKPNACSDWLISRVEQLFFISSAFSPTTLPSLVWAPACFSKQVSLHPTPESSLLGRVYAKRSNSLILKLEIGCAFFSFLQGDH